MIRVIPNETQQRRDQKTRKIDEEENQESIRLKLADSYVEEVSDLELCLNNGFWDRSSGWEPEVP